MGIERQEVIRHARWDAEREDLLLQKKVGLLPLTVYWGYKGGK